MKVLIVEDEIHNQRMLEGMILALRPGWKIVSVLESVKETVEWIGQNTADIIFMDIQLTDGLCFSVFEQVKLDSPVIFTTAYDNYAIRAFKVNSIDYLLKPVKENELEKAIVKFENQLNKQKGAILPVNYDEIITAIKQGEKKYRKRFLVHGVNAYYKLETSEIAYISSENKITTAVTYENKEHVLDYTLERLEEELEPDQFFRANRNTILHVDAIQKIEDYFGGKLHVKLKNPFQHDVIISRLKNAAFKEWIGK